MEIEGMSVYVTGKTLISRSQDAGRLPSGFDFEVKHDPNHPTEVPADSDGVACGFLVWKLPPEPPPMIAVVTCEFRVNVDGETHVTEPITLVLQSQEGLLMGADSPLAEEQAKKVLEVLARLPGKKSAWFVNLVQRIRDRVADNED